MNLAVHWPLNDGRCHRNVAGVEIVDEDDLDGIEEGTTAEDLREFAKEKFGQTNGDEINSDSEE